MDADVKVARYSSRQGKTRTNRAVGQTANDLTVCDAGPSLPDRVVMDSHVGIVQVFGVAFQFVLDQRNEFHHPVVFDVASFLKLIACDQRKRGMRG